MDSFIKDKVRVTLENLLELSVKETKEIDNIKCFPCEYKHNNDLPIVDSGWSNFGRNDRVKGYDTHYWFYTEILTPNISSSESVYMEVITGHEGEWDAKNPQGILYLNGNLTQGLDINHNEVFLQPNTKYTVYIYFYIGLIDGYTDFKINIKTINNKIKNLYYDMKVPYDAAMCFAEDNSNHINFLKVLNTTCNILDLKKPYSDEFFCSLKVANDYLYNEFYIKECSKEKSIVNYIGHTHIDVAWHWTLAQTREKVQRSFATVLSLMERYPEYVFMSSQPQLYEFLKEEAPEIYSKVKKRVEEGRWEVEGAMWLEADCNLASGESLIRQILFGKKFIKDEFKKDSHILWLPDVFGYSSALPQILKKSGIDTFVTSKISWNETNKIPYDTFLWEGLDGTEIFTYFLTAQTHEEYLQNKTYTAYVGDITPSMNLGTWERYQQKDYNNETIVTFGHGDGGGGPTEEMLETAKRLSYGFPGMPSIQMSKVSDFIERVKNNFYSYCDESHRTPRWVGELYLEKHRGTYTSIAKIKKNNRKSEFLCQETETISIIDSVLLDTKYPKKEIHSAWQTILLNQFHDILPGSSIEDVYTESETQFKELNCKIGRIRNKKLETLSKAVSKRGIFVYNPNSFTASDYVVFDNKLIFAKDIPPFGWKVIQEGITEISNTVLTSNKLENNHYSISFDNNYFISSLFDKDNNREIVKPGELFNTLCVYEDYPRAYDNWEITNYYIDKPTIVDNVISAKLINENGWTGIEIIRKFQNSTITQKIFIYENSRRIDVFNEIDWHEHHLVLKALFPVDIHSNKANYDVQFGYVERPTHSNTSWDEAKFEVCAYKWADLSEEGYGVSILNDCKYGYSILGNEMTITLLKCGTYPNPNADQGNHSFVYSVLPHSDSLVKCGTIQESYLLNRPMTALRSQGNGILISEYSLVQADCGNIIIETIKESEENNNIVLRLYDACNMKTRPKIKFGFPIKSISLCDMMENPIKRLNYTDSLSLDVGNFEIITLLIER